MADNNIVVRGSGIRGIAFPIAKGREGYWTRKNAKALTQTAIQMVLGTTPGERVGMPEFGSRLRYLVYEPNDEALSRAIREETVGALARWYPQIHVVGVMTESTDNRIAIFIDYIDLTDEKQEVRSASYAMSR